VPVTRPIPMIHLPQHHRRTTTRDEVRAVARGWFRKARHARPVARRIGRGPLAAIAGGLITAVTVALMTSLVIL